MSSFLPGSLGFLLQGRGIPPEQMGRPAPITHPDEPRIVGQMRGWIQNGDGTQATGGGPRYLPPENMERERGGDITRRRPDDDAIDALIYGPKPSSGLESIRGAPAREPTKEDLYTQDWVNVPNSGPQPGMHSSGADDLRGGAGLDSLGDPTPRLEFSGDPRDPGNAQRSGGRMPGDPVPPTGGPLMSPDGAKASADMQAFLNRRGPGPGNTGMGPVTGGPLMPAPEMQGPPVAQGDDIDAGMADQWETQQAIDRAMPARPYVQTPNAQELEMRRNRAGYRDQLAEEELRQNPPPNPGMTAPLPGPGETTRAPGALRGMGAPPSSGAGGPGDDPGDNGLWGTGAVSNIARRIFGEEGSANAAMPPVPPDQAPYTPPPGMPGSPNAPRGIPDRAYTPSTGYEPGGGTMPPAPTRRGTNGGPGGQRGRTPPPTPMARPGGVQPMGEFEDVENSPQAPSGLPALMQSTWTPEGGYQDTTAAANATAHPEGTAVAQPAAADQVTPNPAAASQSGGSGDDASNDKWMALLQAGLATLASNKPGLEAIGEGGQVGLESYRDSQRRRDRLQQQQIENERANRGEGREDRRIGYEGQRVGYEGQRVGLEERGLDLRGELGRGELAAREKSLGLEAAGLSQRERIANVQAALEGERNRIAAEGNVLQQQGLVGQDLNGFYSLSQDYMRRGMPQAEAEAKAMQTIQAMGAGRNPYAGLEGLLGSGRAPLTDDQVRGAARP